jgi:sulfopyruvate decarboxylase subunit beta
MTRADAVARVARRLRPDWLVVACNGMIGRELYATGDRPAYFYMIGSMGLASSIGLGLALVRPARTVVVLDGDGNVLMNMGALASAGALQAANFYHVVFDNAAHGSTGGQKTIADRVPLDRVAKAAGYRRSDRVAIPSAVEAAVEGLFAAPGPGMLVIDVAVGNVAGIGRVEPSPVELAERFRARATGAGPAT